MQLDPTTSERRRHPRTLSHPEAVVKPRHGIFPYDVSNLSAGGALLNSCRTVSYGRNGITGVRPDTRPKTVLK